MLTACSEIQLKLDSLYFKRPKTLVHDIQGNSLAPNIKPCIATATPYQTSTRRANNLQFINGRRHWRMVRVGKRDVPSLINILKRV